MTRWIVVGGGTAGCVVAAQLGADRPADEVLVLESGPSLGGASRVNGGVVVGDPGEYRHRLPLEPPAAIGPLGRALQAADELAAPVLLARRGGRRVDVAEAYLDPLPGNVEVRTNTGVLAVLCSERTAVGVATTAGELAGDRVVVCAGAVATPALLLRSGIDTPGVGHGLQNHVGVALVCSGSPGLAHAPDAPDVTVTAEHGDTQFLAIEANPAMDGYGALVAGLLAVHAEGRVSLPDPSGPPVVDAAALAHPTDRARLQAAVAALLALANHAALRAVAEHWFVDDHGTRLATLLAGGADAVAAWVAAAPNPYHHTAASCRLGVVTDSGGWLRGYRGIALADASVLRGVPRRNTYLSVIDVAARLSAGWSAR